MHKTILSCCNSSSLAGLGSLAFVCTFSSVVFIQPFDAILSLSSFSLSQCLQTVCLDMRLNDRIIYWISLTVIWLAFFTVVSRCKCISHNITYHSEHSNALKYFQTLSWPCKSAILVNLQVA
jgi:hypothetical protein